MLKSADGLFADLALDFNGASRPVVLNEILKAARAFFNDSEVWIETLDALDATADQTEFELSFPQHALVKRILKLYYGAPATRSSSVMDRTMYEILPDGVVRLYTYAAPSVATTGYLLPEVVLVPARNAHELPMRHVELHGDAILAKARANMFAMTGMPWADPARAEKFAREYSSLLGDAKTEAIMRGTKGQVRLTTPFF